MPRRLGSDRLLSVCVSCSGGSRGEARPPLFWVKKEEMTEGKMAAMASKSRPGPP